MESGRVVRLVLCFAVAPFVMHSVGSITVQQKAGFPDVADRAHHGPGKAAKPHLLTSPGIVSAVVKVKVAPATGTKRAVCEKPDSGKCAKHTEWDSQETRDDSAEENYQESDDIDSSVEVQDKGTKSVKVVSGLDESIDEDDYGKSKKNEQNEISDVPIYSGSFVGVNEEEDYDRGFPRKEWNPKKHLIGGHHHFGNIPFYGHGGQFQFEYPPAPNPAQFNIHDSVFEMPNSRYHPSLHAPRAPRPYHSLMYGRTDAYPLHEPVMPRLLSGLRVQKPKKDMLHVDDKIDFPKEK